MALQTRQKIWREFINSPKLYMSRFGPGTSLVEWGWTEINYNRLNTVVERALPSPSKADQLSLLSNISKETFIRDVTKDIQTKKDRAQLVGLKIYYWKIIGTDIIRVYWHRLPGRTEVNCENEARTFLVDILEEFYSRQSSEDITSIRSKGSFSGFTLEHGDEGGPGYLEAETGSVSGAAEKVKGLRVQKEILNALAKYSDSYSSGLTATIVNWLDCNFNIEDELIKNRDIKKINDRWGGRGQITLDKRTVPGTSIPPNNSKVDTYIRTEFEKFMRGTGPGSYYEAIENFVSNLSGFKKVDALAGSRGADQAVLDYAIANFALIFTKTGTIDKRYKINKTLLKKAKKEVGKSRGRHKAKSKGAKVTQRKARGGSTGSAAKKHHASTDHPLALREMINAVLPDEVLKQMGSPALVNRTGRFRQSARVTNVLTGPRGGVQIDYTYQRNPYEVFEPGSGSPLANQYRDPRKIIGQTVREIAQELMGRKFIKVRRV